MTNEHASPGPGGSEPASIGPGDRAQAGSPGGSEPASAGPADRAQGTAASLQAGPSPLAAALDRVGDRWSLLLVEALLGGARRYGELAGTVPGIAPNILAGRLRRLERAGIVRARPYSDRPPRMEYALTADGLELAGALRLLADWGARRTSQAETLRHVACGTPLDARWYCPTCAVAVTDPDLDGLDRL